MKKRVTAVVLAGLMIVSQFMGTASVFAAAGESIQSEGTVGQPEAAVLEGEAESTGSSEEAVNGADSSQEAANSVKSSEDRANSAVSPKEVVQSASIPEEVNGELRSDGKVYDRFTNQEITNLDTVTNLFVKQDVVVVPSEKFSGKANLTRLRFENADENTTTKTIGEDAFGGTRITDVKLPKGVSVIGNRAFKDVTTLTKVEFGEGLARIGEETFKGTTGLTKVDFRKCGQLMDVSARAFEGSSLSTMIIGQKTGRFVCGRNAFATNAPVKEAHFLDNNGNYLEGSDAVAIKHDWEKLTWDNYGKWKLVTKIKPPFPNVTTDYDNMKLTGFDTSLVYEYTMDGRTQDLPVDADGTTPILKEWSDKHLKIMNKETDTHVKSEPKLIMMTTLYTITINGQKSRDAVLGRTVTLTAPEKPGYSFLSWGLPAGVTGVNVTDPTITFTMQGKDLAFTANYKTLTPIPNATADYDNMKLKGLNPLGQYKITADGTTTSVAADGEGKIDISKDWGNKTIQIRSVTEDFQYEGSPQNLSIEPIYTVMVDGSKYKDTIQGKTISITAEEKPGQTFIKWTATGLSQEVVLTNKNITFPMPGNEVALTKVYKQAGAVPGATPDYTNMKLTGLTPSAKYKITANGVSEQIQADSKGQIDIKKKWGGQTIQIVAVETETHLQSPAQHITINAIYTVTVNSTPNVNAIQGASVRIEAGENPGHTFKTWVAVGLSNDVDLTQEVLTFNMPPNDVTLIAQYTQDGIEPSAPSAVADYDVMKLTGLIPSTKYKVTVDTTSNEIVSDSTGAMPILDTWSGKTITIAVATVGSIPEGAPQSVVIKTIYTVTVDDQVYKKTVEGKSITLTAEQREGFTFKEWKATGVTLPDTKATTITFTMPPENVTLKKVYKQNGTIPSATADYDNMKLKGLTPSAQYKIDVNGTSQEMQAGTGGDIPLSKEWGGQTIKISAMETETHVESPPQSLRISPIYTVMVNGGVYKYATKGVTITLTAQAKSGYTFEKWVAAGLVGVTLTEESISFQMPGNDVTLLADYMADGEQPTPAAPNAVADYDKMKLTGLEPLSQYKITQEFTSEEVMSSSEGEIDILKNWSGKTISVAVAAGKGKPQGTPKTLTISPIFTITVDQAIYKHTVQGKQVSLTAEDRAGYRFTKWTATGVTITNVTNKTVTFQMPGNDVALTKQYRLNDDEPAASNAPDAEVDYDKMKLTGLKASTGYKVAVDGTAQEVVADGNGEINLREEWGGKAMRLTVAPTKDSSESAPQNLTIRPIYKVMVDGEMYKYAIEGKQISVTAERRPLDTFVKWMEAGITLQDSRQESITFEMPRNDVTLLADYTPKDPKPEVPKAPSATANYDNMKLRGLTPSTKYKVTVERNIQEIISDGSGEMDILKKWSDKNIKIANAQTENKPEGLPQTLKIQPIYTVMLDGTEYKNTVEGKSISVTAQENAGYEFRRWVVSGVSIEDLTQRTLQFKMPWNDVTLAAVYEAVGDVPEAPNARANYDEMKLTGLSASTRYKIIAEGTPELITSDSNGKIDIQKRWSDKTITISTAQTGGTPESAPQSLTIQTIYTVLVDGEIYTHTVAGKTVRVTAKERPGKIFKEWTAVGIDITNPKDKTVSFTMPDRDVTLIATYIDGSSIPGVPEAEVNYDEMKLTGLRESTKYKVVVGETSEEITSSSNGEIGILKQWSGQTIKIAVAASNGTPESPAQTLTIQTIYTVTVDGSEYKNTVAGKTVSVTAESREGQIFVRWTAEGITLADLTANPITFEMPENDVTLQKVYKTSTAKPTAGINYGIMKLTNLIPNSVYTIQNQDVTAGADGTVDIIQEWGGQVILIVKKETETHAASAPQMVSIDRIYSLTISGQDRLSVAGQTITATAPPAPAGEQFKQWVATGLDLGGDSTKETVSFVMPSGSVVLQPTYMKIEQPKPPMNFPDVKPGDWFYESVKYVTEQGIMSGMSDGSFAPAVDMDRAQFATTLYRMAGSPKVDYRNQFPDVPPGQFYSNAATWASDNGIITGYTDGRFGTTDPVTREQLVVILYRFEEHSGGDVSGGADLSQYSDMNEVSAFARAPMSWAVGNGIISGDQGQLNPHGKSSRAVVSTVIMRYQTK